MQLLKIYDFKGLWQNGKKMAAPTGYFRRFTNSFKDKTGRILPYGKGAAQDTNVPTNLASAYSAFTVQRMGTSEAFLGKFVQLFLGSTTPNTSYTNQGFFRFSDIDNNPIDIMQPIYSIPATFEQGIEQNYIAGTSDSGRFGTAILFNKLAINRDFDFQKYYPSFGETFAPTKDGILVFDGLRFRAAGLPTPWNAADQGGVLGAHFIRSFYVTIGLDAEVVFSPMLQQRLASDAAQLYLGAYSALPSTRRPDAITGTVTSPATTVPLFRQADDTIFNSDRRYDTRFARISTGLSVSAGVLTATLSASSPGLQVGDWLMIHVESVTLFPGLTGPTLMFQVRSIGASITFEDRFKVLNASNVTWEEVESFDFLWSSVWTGAQQTSFTTITQAYGALSNIFAIYTYSTTENGTYQLCAEGIRPFCFGSTLTYLPTSLANARINGFPFLGVITRFLTDWYEVSVVKTLFPPVMGITAYKDLLVGHDNNAIYFSDISRGGSSEMTSGQANFAPNGSQFGKLTAVCGSEDFLFFSRERKNFVIRGDIATGAISVTECDLAVEGAYNSRCCSNAWGGKVIFMNRTGIYACDSMGTIQELSEPIRDLFIGQNIDGNLFNSAVFRTPAQLADFTPANPSDPYFDPQDGSTFKISLDAERGWIISLTSNTLVTVDEDATPIYSVTNRVDPNLLVYDTNDGSWYEFQGNGAGSVEATLSRILSLSTTAFYKEDGVLRGSEKQTILTQWTSAGEPSLEKQVNQIKLFGEFIATPGGTLGCTVGQQNDWKRYSGTPVLNTSATYTVTDATQYNHKKRLNSSKPQVTSILLESLAEGGMKIEGMEIEGDILQEGTKR